MPEGDTIHRAARRLHDALAGQPVRRVRGTAPGVRGAGLEGRVVVAVEARGKHLMVRFDDGRALHTHMRMTGRWHLYRPGERWRAPRHECRVALTTDDWEAVCFGAPTVELIRHDEYVRSLAQLGPDLLSDDFPERLPEAVERLRRDGSRPLGEAVMDQRLVAGIGNVFKSELLFMRGLDPFSPVSAFDEDTLRALLEDARHHMQRSLRHPRGRRQTRFGSGPHQHVYRRAGEHCLKCGDTIRMRRQGELRRSTYHCPTCQPAPG